MSTYKERFSAALQNEHERLLDPVTRDFNSISTEVLNKCPVCDATDFSIYCVKDKFVHKRCSNCGLVYLDPKLSRQATLAFYNSPVNEVYNEEKFHKEDAASPDDIENLENYEILLKNITDIKGKRLLEIGPGKGTFLARATRDGFETHAVELNSLLIENLKKITPHIYTDDIQNISLPDNYFDAIYFRDVMEHIDRPIPFLQTISRILKPGGIALIDTHNINSLVNTATKQYHTVIFAFEHPVHWSPESLKYAGEKAGLIQKETHFSHLYQSLGRIVNYRLYPSFTYIYPPSKGGLSKLFYKIADNILNISFVQAIDKKMSVWISSIFKKGAKMQMVFTKK